MSAVTRKILFRDVSKFVKARVLYNPMPPLHLLQFCDLPAALECNYHCVVHSTAVIILSGEIYFRTPDDAEFSGTEGDLFLLPGNSPYLWRTGKADAETFQGGYFLSGGYNFSNLSPFLYQGKNRIIQIRLEKELFLAFKKKVTEMESAEFPAFHCSLALFELLGRTFSSAHMQHFQPETMDMDVQKILHYIEDNLNKDLSIGKLMQVAHVSRRKLFLLFNEYIGMSPLRYIARRKIHLAVKMVEAGNLGTSEIAQELGFSSSNYFIRFFKKHTKMAPSAMSRKISAKTKLDKVNHLYL